MTETLDYKTHVANLEERGYRCTYYGETAQHNGLAYFENESQVLRIEYAWNKIGENQYVAGHILDIEDVTVCYR